MPTKKAIIACSNAGLDYLDFPKDMEIFRSVILFENEDPYEDFIQMDAKTFYERIAEKPSDVPKTAYVAPGRMIEIFEDYQKKGYEEIIVITISSKLSGLYEAVISTAKEVDIKVTVFDSKTIAYIQAYMALEAHRLAGEGKSTEDIISHLEKIREHNQWYFAVDTLMYLVKNGRLSTFKGLLGTIMKLKPLLEISKEGSVANLEKIRTTSKAIDRVIEKYLEDTKDMNNVLTYISHAHNDEMVEYITKKVQEVYPNREVRSSYLTPVVGAHTGPKSIGLGYLDLDKLD